MSLESQQRRPTPSLRFIHSPRVSNAFAPRRQPLITIERIAWAALLLAAVFAR